MTAAFFRCRLLLLAGVMAATGCTVFEKEHTEVVKVERRHNRRKAVHFSNAGFVHYNAGNLEMAVVSFENAIQQDETYGPPHNNLGLIFFDNGDLLQAAMAFETAMNLMPGDPAPYNNLGLVFESAGKLFEAVELYQTAYEMCPTCAEYLGNLVRVRIRLGAQDELVREQLRQLLFIDTRPEWIEWAEEQLSLKLNPLLDRGPAEPDISELYRRPTESPSEDDRPTDDGTPPPAPAPSFPSPEDSLQPGMGEGDYLVPPLEGPPDSLVPTQFAPTLLEPPTPSNVPARTDGVGRTRISASLTAKKPPKGGNSLPVPNAPQPLADGASPEKRGWDGTKAEPPPPSFQRPLIRR